MIGSVLVANRGEIACRILKTARTLGIRTIAVATEADRSWLHWQEADEVAFIGAGPVAESYLNGEAIIRAARETGAEAIHPGYGFLSENAEFAQQCANAGIIFVGPSPEAIRAMGSKSQAKGLMEDAGVPVVPGYHGERQQPEFLKQKAYEIGYPVMIKAVSGGGGRGMRLVNKAIEFDDQLAAARREAQASFGDDRVLIERYLNNPRHIEVQVFGDTHGNLVHLFERDCSVQRRHQKVIEESPAPGLSEAVRLAMGEAAVSAARAVDYYGAGTVEFIADADDLSRPGGFFFMEMNTRLQVEHPITEMITGLDLVEWQLRIASGEPIPLSQGDLSFRGHSIEARIYAEDPGAGFRPSTGKLWAAEMPGGDDVRIDTGVRKGSFVSPYYDSMLAKIIVHAPGRAAAILRLREALADVRIAGVKTNTSFLAAILADPVYLAGAVETGYVDGRLPDLTAGGADYSAASLAVAEWLDARANGPVGPWSGRSGFEIGGLGRTSGLDLLIDGKPASAELTWRDGSLEIAVAGRASCGAPDAQVVWGDGTAFVLAGGDQLAVSFPSPLERAAQSSGGSGRVAVPMHGRIASVRVEAGDRIHAGDVLFTLEAMKMEHSIKAPVDGTVSQMLVAEGAQVDEGAAAVVIEPGDPGD